MDAFGRILEILVTVVLLFFIPVYYTSIQQDLICQSQVRAQTVYFVDAVRNQGYITQNMYELFLKELDLTGQVYDVEISYYKKTETINDEGEYTTHYECSYGEEFLTQEIVELEKGGFFKAEVENKSQPLSAKITKLLLGSDYSKRKIYTVYGGAVKDEIQ